MRITGSEQPPEPWTSFSACSFHPGLARALAGLGFESPSEIQSYCWPLVLSGRDVVGVAQTGSGKTLAFLVPAFERYLKSNVGKPAVARKMSGSPAMLVLAPTRELALQIESEAQKLGPVLGIGSCCLYGGVDFKGQLVALSQKKPALVVACPGRLKDMAAKKKICLSSVHFLCLDEADRMLDMGFEEDLRDIIGRLPQQERQTVMFTATLPKKVLHMVSHYTQNAITVHQSGHEETRCNPNVSQEIRLCLSQADKIAALLGFLKALQPGDRAIVFVNTKAAIDGVCRDLKHAGLAPVTLHGDLDQREREQALEDFRKGDSCLAVATDVASRGLDVRDVRAVVCFDASRDADSHVHRVGRTGRAGATGKAVTLIRRSNQADLQMARHIFRFMRECGQSVDPALEAEVEASRESKEDIVEDSAGQLLIAEDSSGDESGGDGDGGAEWPAREAAGWKPWHQRSCDFSADSFAPLLSMKSSVQGPAALREGSSMPVCSGASDVGSVLSGTTYLQNAVEHMFGHAAARDISASLCHDTVRSGCRLLTHDGSNKSGTSKPYRWMVFRRVSLADIASSLKQQASNLGSTDADFVWHVVVHELARTRADKVRVVTNYFKSNIGLVYDYIRDAFQFLDEDDPEIIRTAVSNESVVNILRLYFEVGDTTNPKFYHNMAKANLWPCGTLLHYCCEKGFALCVAYLLKHHAPHTAPRDKPWLQLADPFYLEPSWMNSAFHCAAWEGESGVMNELVRWCGEHQQVSKIRYLFDKKRSTPMDLVEMRLKACLKRPGQDASCYKATFNSLAAIFNKRPFEHVSGQQLEPQRCIFISDHQDTRRPLDLPSGELTLQDLVHIVSQQADYLLSGDVHTLLLSRIDIKPLDSADAEQFASNDLASLARLCTRVAFVNCSAAPATAIHICQAVSYQLLKLRDGVKVAWETLAFPAWSEVPAGGSQEFAQALLDLAAAVRETCPLHALQSVQLAVGTTMGYLPASQRHLPQVLSAPMQVKAVARRLLGQHADEWQETDLWKRVQGPADRPLCGNPLLKGPDTLERKLLDRGALSVSADVCSCLSPGWGVFVEALADGLVRTTATMPEWAPLVAGRDVGEEERGLQLVRKLADEALLHLLKMRRSKRRPDGLPSLRRLVGPYLHEVAESQELFPKSLDYFRKRLGGLPREVGGP